MAEHKSKTELRNYDSKPAEAGVGLTDKVNCPAGPGFVVGIIKRHSAIDTFARTTTGERVLVTVALETNGEHRSFPLTIVELADTGDA